MSIFFNYKLLKREYNNDILVIHSNGVVRMKRKLNIPMLVISIINLIFVILLTVFLNNLHIIPLGYMILLWFILLAFCVGMLFIMKQKNKILRWVGYVISAIFVIFSIVVIYYVERTNNFLNKAFGNATNTYINSYYVVTLSESAYGDIKDFNNSRIGYYDNVPNIQEALEELEKTIKTTNMEYEDFDQTFEALDIGSIAGVVIEKSLYQFILEYDTNLKQEKYSILYMFDVEIEEEQEEIDTDSDSFSIYIGGVDFTETYTDFNMIVTVNKKTHKILLTSTPRDYYIELYGKYGSRDLLGYAGVWGINTSVKSLENLYNINIDYYVKINTKSLVGLVDTLGGVEFCSDISYTTTHATVMGTYNDTQGKKLRVTEGCKKYSGIEILTIARERLAYPDGDRQRQKNCQQIMINIFNKITRPENITNYVNILNAVSDLYTTNIPKDLVTELAKDTISGMNGWHFEQQSVTGRDSIGHVHLSNIMGYVMVPDMDSVEAATNKINEIAAGR